MGYGIRLTLVLLYPYFTLTLPLLDSTISLVLGLFLIKWDRIGGKDALGAEGLAVGTENECSVLAGIEDH